MNLFKLSTTVLLAGSFSLPAMADESFYDTARVLSVMPQVERINNPRQECHTEQVRESYYQSGDRDIGGAIIGGIAGGLLGSQIGKGKGRIAGAAVGAATAALVGDRIDNSDKRDSGYRTRPVERCVYVDNWQTVTRNYLVTYRYNDHDYTTTLNYDPGSTMRVRVAVAPEPVAKDVVGYLPGYPAGRDDDWGRRGRRHDHGHWDD